jgi:cytochrome c551/c552
MKEVNYILQGFLLFLFVAFSFLCFRFFVFIKSEEQVLPSSAPISTTSIKYSPEALKGKTLFQQNCASCHALFKDLTGPGLAGVRQRWSSEDMLITWIRNWNLAVASGDPYATKIKNWSTASMITFTLSDEEIKAVLAYIDESTAQSRPLASR